MRFLLPLSLLFVIPFVACTSGETARAATPTGHPAPSGMESLARFRTTVGPRPVRFEGGAPSRDSLVRAVVHAVEQADAAALSRLALSPAEFAYFYYPENPQSKPPYELQPDIMWLQMQSQSHKGSSRLLSTYGQQPLRFHTYACDSVATVIGHIRTWGHCRVTHTGPDGKPKTTALFAAIIEREGIYKILSYANEL